MWVLTLLLHICSVLPGIYCLGFWRATCKGIKLGIRINSGTSSGLPQPEATGMVSAFCRLSSADLLPPRSGAEQSRSPKGLAQRCSAVHTKDKPCSWYRKQVVDLVRWLNVAHIRSPCLKINWRGVARHKQRGC